MDVFAFRNSLVSEYERFSRSFAKIGAGDIKSYIDAEYENGRFWPAPLIQLNPSFVAVGSVESLVAQGVLHPECGTIFRYGKTAEGALGTSLTLHKHQAEAIEIARRGESYVLTTGTGSGKSLAYFIPIIDQVLRKKAAGQHSGGISAIVVYPMNALCNSQQEELEKFLCLGYPKNGEPVRFNRYTGQESKDERASISANPPDILLTNYVMLELLMTRRDASDLAIVEHAKGLKFLVLDELHTYRGRQGADVALLVRRVRERFNTTLVTVGTSATMASEDTAANRSKIVAFIATRLFGAEVKPENVVTETLQRVTPEDVPTGPSILAASVRNGVPKHPKYEELQHHPVAAWVEMTLGLERQDSKVDGKLVRIRRPKTLLEAADLLSDAAGLPAAECSEFLAGFLLAAYYTRNTKRQSLFAFRLHQFIAGAGDVFTTLEPEGTRHITVNGQQFKPGERTKLLFNAAFCRECGQEYYPTWVTWQAKKPSHIEPRELSDKSNEDDDLKFGFFMPDTTGIFDAENFEEGYPEDWLDFDKGSPRLKPNYRKYRPHAFTTNTVGDFDSHGLAGWIIPGSFRFCLACGVSYDGSIRSEISKLSSLSTEGRSSATTVLTLASLKYLLGAPDLEEKAKKILGFTDNRQDASLQAGHFNDFVQVLLLRGALLSALQSEPSGVLTDDILTHRVFEHLRLEPGDYSASPDAKGARAENARKALRDVLGYRLYFDLRRGWRITNPNLEQLRLLHISYQSLDTCCDDESEWGKCHPLLAHVSPKKRKEFLIELLDTMRRGLCIKTIYLDEGYQEQLRNRSYAELKEPWGLGEDERPVAAAAMVPRPKPANRRLDVPAIFVSYRSRFGRKIRSKTQWGAAAIFYPTKFDEDTYNDILDEMLGVLERYGLADPVDVDTSIKGYRVPASVIEWTLAPEAGRASGSASKAENPFFLALYDNVAKLLSEKDRFLHQLEAREHTAQVDSDIREQREEQFRSAKLPMLFCSPTMELGVDISTLNTVYMRNVPPTPANYAQRSGRAGRSGQPALVVTYCAARSPHDQYFFADPARMVAGSVNPPTLDLANEELVRSHLHSVWLAETGQKLGASVRDVLDLGTPDKLPIREDIIANIDMPQVRQRAAKRGLTILSMLKDDLTPDLAPWYGDEWLDSAISAAHLQFNDAFERWRSLYRATAQQMEKAHIVQMNAAAGEKERKEAKQRYDEARIQQELLLDSRTNMNSDFYTYRYLASQGFLPGYNFPRLPLMAYIPARREKIGRESFLSRPRFLGLSEFGPQSIIYHEGSTYRVRKAILGVRDEESVTTSAKLPVRSTRLCPSCGYGHFGDQQSFERCVNCNAKLELGRSLLSLYRIEQVSTRRADRITSDEEERQRQGYETITTLRFAEERGQARFVPVTFSETGDRLLEVRYGPAATIWRINLGWRRRKDPSIYGFNIDVTTGEWTKDDQAPDDVNETVGRDARTVQRITPYVEDRRNVLIIQPLGHLEENEMATLQYALKRGIEAVFQLEESELAGEPLPDRDDRNAILYYESSEGGAGALTRLAADPSVMRRVAQRALEICHYTSKSGVWGDEDDLENADEDCEAGCYKCLLSYFNQPEHKLLDRRNPKVLNLLCRLVRSESEKGSTTGESAADAFTALMNLCTSSLEKDWLNTVQAEGFALPDHAQPLLSEFGTQPDFSYGKTKALIYVDGPHHHGKSMKQIDMHKRQALRDAGYKVIVFTEVTSDWAAVFKKFSFVFGNGASK